MMHKLIFMNHILQVEQEKHNVNGITQEVKEFIDIISLPNCFQERISHIRWKTLVKGVIANANENEVRESSESYKKMKKKIKDSDKCNDCLSSLPLSQVRTFFKHKYSMTESVKINYKGDATFTKLLWKCQECMNQDTEIHLLWCPAYEDLRMGMDLSSDKDLCSYLQKVIQIRCKENKK